MKRAALLVLVLALVPWPARADAPPYSKHSYERIGIPMRDGVVLSADVWRPVTENKVPVLLTITPYHALYKALDRNETDLPADFGQPFVLRAGYAYVRVDLRGTYNSGGCWNYGGIKEREDGYDVVEWLAARPWANGKVAMIGASYDGTTANAAAIEQPPSLATIVPISSISRWWGYAYQQGARATISGESIDLDPPAVTPTDFQLAYGMLPPPDPTPDNATQVAMRWNLCDRTEQTVRGYAGPDYDAYWTERDYLRAADRVKVPVLVAHGLQDYNVKTWEGTAWFQALDVPKMMVLGQWAHALPSYGQWNSILRKWLDLWLYGIDTFPEGMKPVHVAANGGAFRTQNSWGDGPVSSHRLSGGPRSYLDDGLLTESEMLRGVTPDRYVRVAVPGTSEGMLIEGRPVLRLSASSDSTSTHLVAVLCDVGADGVCNVVSRAFMDARYRQGLERAVDLVPGERHTYALEFIDKDWVVAPGRHLEVIIASTSNTWVAPDRQRATNTLYLDESTLEIPRRSS